MRRRGYGGVEDGPRTDVPDSLSYDYDLAGRLSSAKQDGITLPGGGTGVTTTYLWDDASERVRVSQPLTSSLTHVRNWTYDATGRMASLVENGNTTTYTYGPGNQLEQVGDPRGITLRFEYDNLGRQTRRYQAGPPVADDQTFSYDQSGNVLSANVVATSTAIKMDYDNDGRLQKVYQASFPTPTTTYAYDSSTGRLSSITDPAGTTAYSLYDANGLLKEITDPFSATKVCPESTFFIFAGEPPEVSNWQVAGLGITLVCAAATAGVAAPACAAGAAGLFVAAKETASAIDNAKGPGFDWGQFASDTSFNVITSAPGVGSFVAGSIPELGSTVWGLGCGSSGGCSSPYAPSWWPGSDR